MRDILINDGHRRSKLIGFRENIGIKQSFPNDTHGNNGHLLVDVNDAAIGPGLRDLLAIVTHDVGIGGNVAWLEGWRHQLALVTVEIAFAAKDAITNEGTKGVVNGHAFVEVIGMFDQNAVDVFWFVELNEREWSKVDAADVALPCHALQEAQAVVSESGQVAYKWISTNEVKCFLLMHVWFNLSDHDSSLYQPACDVIPIYLMYCLIQL